MQLGDSALMVDPIGNLTRFTGVSVSVNGAVLEAGIPFAANVSLDTVRFLTTNLNEENISGRTFDNVVITR